MRRTLRISVTTTNRLRATGGKAAFCPRCAAEAGGSEAVRFQRMLASIAPGLRGAACERHTISEGETR
jgi:hypothetical protein